MKIKCLDGFFIMDELEPGSISRFQSRFGLELVPFREKFTFKQLEDAPDYAIKGQAYIGATATKTFSGEPWEIFKANSLIFDFTDGVVKQKTAVSALFKIEQAGNYWISQGLILPGSMTTDGKKIISYSCHFFFDSMRFRYSEVTYD
jgi:hypothetical protein